MKNTNPNHPIDARFREALQGHASPGGQALWAKLEGQLPPEKKRRPFGLWAFAALVLGASLGAFFLWPAGENAAPNTQNLATAEQVSPSPQLQIAPQTQGITENNEATKKTPLAAPRTALPKTEQRAKLQPVKRKKSPAATPKPQAARPLSVAAQVNLPQMLNTAPLADLHPQTLPAPVEAGKLQKLPDSLKPKPEVTVYVRPGQPAAREEAEAEQTSTRQKLLEDAKRIGKAAKKLKFGEIFNKK